MTPKPSIDPYNVYYKLIAMSSIGAPNYKLEINGVIFFAGNFDVDELFYTITGMTKTEYDKSYLEKNVENNWRSWKLTGKYLLPKEKYPEWEKLIKECRQSSRYYGEEIEYALTIIQTINYGKSFKQAINDVMESQPDLNPEFKIAVEQIVSELLGTSTSKKPTKRNKKPPYKRDFFLKI